MEIDIKQDTLSWGNKFQIFTDGQKSHISTRKFLRMLPQITLIEANDSKRIKMTINKHFSTLGAKYDITTENNSILQFRTKSVWKRHYQCQYSFDTYDIYGHRGRKYSIFRNDIQVAWWDRNDGTWLPPDNYKIITDSDCDTELIISFCLVVDNFSNEDNDGNRGGLGLGYVGREAKKFDRQWRPK